MASFPVLNSVVWRMRIAMIAIVVLIVNLLVGGSIGLEAIGLAQARLTEDAIPRLARIEQTGQRMSQLDDALTTLAGIPSAAEHDAVVARIAGLIDALGEEAGAQPSDRDARIIGGRLEASADKMARIVEELRGNRRQIRALGAATAEREARLISSIAEATLASGSELETLVLSGAIGTDHAALADGISLLNTSTYLGSLLERHRDQTAALVLAETPRELTEFRQQLAFNQRSAIRQLANLPSDGARAPLVADFRALWNFVRGPDGLLAMQGRYIELNARLRRLVHLQSRLISGMQSRARAEIAQARSDTLSTANTVEQTVATTATQLQAIGVGALMVVAIVSFVLVEQRIIVRLTKLAGSVREIAGGDHDHRVSVDGDDELGAMAEALEVFKKNSRELHRSNAELARFAYAASHDLRTPLRAIRDLAEWTLEDAGDGLPPDCRTNLEMMLQRADRLSHLLSDLLDYSRIGRAPASIDKLDLADLVPELIELLGAKDRVDAQVSGDALELHSYAAPLRQILLNLISNAIKHHDGDHVRLAVRSERLAEGVRISVGDDGPGIAPRYHERVFGMFETLHSRDEVEGSGMGLAIIRKLVEQYGGAIQIRSDPSRGRGTTFLFTWPVITAGGQQDLAA